MKIIMINGKFFAKVKITSENIERCFPMAKKIIEIPDGWNIVI
jgi:hypothetical protein